jgi:hypothetical protein
MTTDRHGTSISDDVIESGLRVGEIGAWARIVDCRGLLDARALSLDAGASSTEVAVTNEFGGRDYSVTGPSYDPRLVQLCDDLVAVGAVRYDFDYAVWSGHLLYPGGEGLESAPVAEAVRVATWVVCSEKFVDGSIGEAAANGILGAVVRRLCSWYVEKHGAPRSAGSGAATLVVDGDVSDVDRLTGHALRSPIELLCSVAQLPETFAEEIKAHGVLLRSALDHLWRGDVGAYLALMTTEVATANLTRWKGLGSARTLAAKAASNGTGVGHPILMAARPAEADMVVSASIPTTVRQKVMNRDRGRCVYCNVPLVMPDDWDLLRRFDPCVLPSAVLIDGVARSADGGSLSQVQRAPIIGYRHQLEHLVPRSRGGTNTVNNVVSACGWCNRAKRIHTLAELGLPTPRL